MFLHAWFDDPAVEERYLLQLAIQNRRFGMIFNGACVVLSYIWNLLVLLDTTEDLGHRVNIVVQNWVLTQSVFLSQFLLSYYCGRKYRDRKVEYVASESSIPRKDYLSSILCPYIMCFYTYGVTYIEFFVNHHRRPFIIHFTSIFVICLPQRFSQFHVIMATLLSFPNYALTLFSPEPSTLMEVARNIYFLIFFGLAALFIGTVQNYANRKMFLRVEKAILSHSENERENRLAKRFLSEILPKSELEDILSREDWVPSIFRSQTSLHNLFCQILNTYEDCSLITVMIMSKRFTAFSSEYEFADSEVNSAEILHYIMCYRKFDEIVNGDVFSKRKRFMRKYKLFSTHATPNEVFSVARELLEVAEAEGFSAKIMIKLGSSIRSGIVIARNLIYDVISTDIAANDGLVSVTSPQTISCDSLTLKRLSRVTDTSKWKQEVVSLCGRDVPVEVYKHVLNGERRSEPLRNLPTHSRRISVTSFRGIEHEAGGTLRNRNLQDSQNWLERIEKYGLISLNRRYLLFYRFGTSSFEDFYNFSGASSNAKVASFVVLIFSLSALIMTGLMGQADNAFLTTRNGVRVISYTVLVSLLLNHISVKYWRYANGALLLSFVISLGVLILSLLIVKKEYFDVAMNIFYMTQVIGFWMYPLECIYLVVLSVFVSFSLGYVSAFVGVKETNIFKTWYRVMVPLIMIPLAQAEYVKRRLFQLDWIAGQTSNIQKSLKEKSAVLLQSIYPEYLKKIFLDSKKQILVYEEVGERLLFTKFVESGTFCFVKFDYSKCNTENSFTVINELFQWLENQLDTDNYGIVSDNGSLEAISYTKNSTSDCVSFLLLIYGFILSNPSLAIRISAGLDTGGFHAILGERELFDVVDTWSTHRCFANKLSLNSDPNSLLISRRCLEKWRSERIELADEEDYSFGFGFKESLEEGGVQVCKVEFSDLLENYRM